MPADDMEYPLARSYPHRIFPPFTRFLLTLQIGLKKA